MSTKTTFPFKKEKGPNGLTAIYVPMKSTKTVAVLVLVGTGSRHETKDINGISHFLEHMAFKGTKKRPDKKTIAKELDAVGAEYNAYTGVERTGYHVKVDYTHAELAMDVVSDIFLNSTIPAEEIEKERGVILGEMDMYEDSPMRKVWDILSSLMYPNHPVGWNVVGTKKVIKSLKREDFIRYREDHYRSLNTTVVVAGNITIPKARLLVRKYFSESPEGKTPKPIILKEKQSKPQVKSFYKKTDQTHIVLGFRAYDMSSPKRWPLYVLSNILGGSMSSRLFIKVRDELGLGYYIQSYTSTEIDHGLLTINAGVDTNRTDEAIAVILEELSRIKKEGVSKEEISISKENIRGGTLLGLESSDDLASWYGEQAVRDKNILTPEQEFRMINRVTREDVKKVAKDIFKSNKLNLALVGPHRDGKKFRKLLKL